VRRLLALTMTLPVLAAACGGGSSGSTPAPTSRPPAAPTPSTMDELRSSRVQAVVRVGGAPDAPDWQADGFGAVWVANAAKNAVQRIDPDTNKVVNQIGIGAAPCAGLAAGEGAVWALNCDHGELLRIDPQRNKVVAHIRLYPVDSEGLLAAGGGAVWVLAQDPKDYSRSLLDQIDPSTNTIVKSIPVPAGSTAAAYGSDAVWVSSVNQGTVERVDPEAGKVVATIQVGPQPRFLAAGEGGVWVLNQGDGSVTHIDPSTNSVAAQIFAKVYGSGGCIAAGEGAVWVTMPGTPVLTIDPTTNKITAVYQGTGGDCISTGFGSAWLSNHELGNVWRINAASG